MTRIAFLSDIHGNVPALKAVLKDLEQQAPDEVLVVGDLVGRGPQGSEVVRLIREKGWRSVRGNHEDYLLGYRRGQVPASWHHSREWSALRWMSQELSEDDVAWLEQLPFTLVSHLAPEIRLFHGTYKSNRHGIGPWLREEKLQKYLNFQKESVLICGHTHRPFLHRDEQGMIVNVGSVGLPFNGDGRAQYAMLEKTEKGWEVEFCQVAYNRQETIEVYDSSGFLEGGFTTSRLLLVELQEARPYLVPYILWLNEMELSPEEDHVDEFLAFYDPNDLEKKLAGG